MVMISDGDGTVCVVGCDNQFAYTLMDSASSTEPHIVQVLLTSHCRQIEHSILRYLHCTLPASRSYPASQNTRTHTHTPFMQAVQTVQTEGMYTGIKFRFTHFTASFRWKAFKICQDPTTSKMQFFARFDSTAYFFRSKKNLLRHALRVRAEEIWSGAFKGSACVLSFHLPWLYNPTPAVDWRPGQMK